MTGRLVRTGFDDLIHFVIFGQIVNKKFSTRYYLNLVLVDEEHRRYFKQQEITIFRRRGKEEHEKIPTSPARACS
jgi:hypothetical protein